MQTVTPSQLDLAAQVAHLQKENATLVSLAPLTCSYLHVHHDCVARVPNPNPNPNAKVRGDRYYDYRAVRPGSEIDKLALRRLQCEVKDKDAALLEL